MKTQRERRRGGEFAGTTRFRPLEHIGEGQLGRVYRVHDVETGQDVALKTLPALEADGIYYIKQEFRSLRGIRHFNLVDLYELFVDRDHCFFTMELIEEAQPFTRHVWAHSGRPSPTAGLSDSALTALRASLRQLARGVSALHSKQRLHQDIKPDNVLVTKDGRVVLLDFDMVSRLRTGQVHDADHAGINGTPPYMSPEQIYSRPLTAATDWYSVGVLLFETLFGEVPLDGSLEEIWLALVDHELPPLQSLAPGTPADLQSLVRSLLRPKPDQRAGREAIHAATQEAGGASAYPGWATKSAPFVGRTAELNALRRRFEGLAQEGPTLVCVAGASGIGKTELVDAFLHSIGDRSLILRGTCHHQESVPYKAFDDLIDDLSRYLVLLERDGAPVPVPRYASALTRVFSVLGRVSAFRDADDLEALALPEIRLRAFQALRELLSQLAEARPLILWIDDLQWGDADSVPLFRELLRSPGAQRLMLIVSYRHEEGVLLRELHALREVIASRTYVLPLGPLNASDSRALAAELVSDGTSAWVDDIVEEAAGSPFFLVELARHGEESPMGAALEAPGADRLKQLLRRRVQILPTRERDILEIISVAGKQMDRSLVLQVAELGESGRRDISRLSRENLVRPVELDDRPAIEIYHDRFRQVILADLGSERRRRWHRRLAEALRSWSGAEPEDLLVHYRGAGDTENARAYGQQAAERAMRTLAFDRAAEHYTSMLADAKDDKERADLHEKLGDALANSGRAEDAGASFEAAARAWERVPLEGSREAALDLQRRAAEQYLCGGHVDRGVAVLSSVLRTMGIEYPSTSLSAWMSMLVGQARLWRRGLDYRTSAGAPQPPEERARIEAYWSAGLGLAWVDRTRTAAFQVRYTLLALDAGEPRLGARALAVHASQLASFGGAERLQEGKDVLARAEEIAEGTEDPLLAAFLVMMDGSIAFYDARWRLALERCQRAEETLRAHSRTTGWEMTTARLLSFAAMVYLGRMTELRTRLPGLLDEARARGNLLAEATLASGLPNMVWLSSDEPDEARRRAEESMSLWKQDDFQMQHYFHLIASAQIDLYEGDGSAALQRVVGAWPRLVTSFLLMIENLRITLHHLRARTALAAVARAKETRWPGRTAFLLRLAAWDARQLERESAEWARPLALSVRAGIAAAEGHRDRAGAYLREAARLFDELDMSLYAAAARYQQKTLPSGQVAHRAGEAWMLAHGVAEPRKLAAMLVPGQ